MIRPADTLADWCDRYARARALAKDTHRHMLRSCEILAEWCGQAPIPSGLGEDLLSDWLESIEGLWSPRTVCNHRNNVLTVLRFASDEGACQEPNPRRVRRIRVPDPDPHAWPNDLLSAFFAAAARLEGVCPCRPKLKRASYLLALAGAAYDSALRRGDLFRLQKNSIAADGSIRLRQGKTSEPHLCAVTPHVRQLILAIPYEFPLKWTGKSQDYSNLWKEAREAAGIPSGGLHQMRKNAATDVWEENPELVQRFLGHKTAGMWKYYVDRRRSAKPILPRRNPLDAS